MKKLIYLVMAFVISLTCVGCGTPSGEPTPGPTPGTPGGSTDKSIINVAIINSGLGTAFAEEIEKDFEAYYANTSFEDGKMGVDVKLHPGLDEYNSTKGTLLATIHTLEPTVYILDRIDYQVFVEQDKLVDITATVKEKVYDVDGNLAEATGKEAIYSIEDFMTSGYQKFYKYGTDKYHGIPYYASIGGLIYDADLFDQEKLFFKKNGSIGGTYADIAAGDCSVGPDGVLGTSDDGMPNTMADFSKLLQHMRTNTDVIPFSFSGAYKYTRNGAFGGIHANYEGYDDFMLNFSFDGVDSSLGTISEDVAKDHPDHYTKLLDQEGRKAALRFFQEIAKSEDNWVKGSTTSLDQKQAQDAFIQSIDSNNPVAFLFEGGWWESEARETFEIMEYTNEDWGYGKRNFRLYPYPDMIGEDGVADQTNNERVLYASHCNEGCSIFLSKTNPNATEVAEKIGKKFIQFINQREQLVKFTKNTGGCIRALQIPNVKYTEAELSTLTKYGQSIYDYINEGAKIAFSGSVADVRIENHAGFGSGDGGWIFNAAPAGGLDTNCPIDMFLKGKTTLGRMPTVEEGFTWMRANIKSKYSGL